MGGVRERYNNAFSCSTFVTYTYIAEDLSDSTADMELIGLREVATIRF